jgi:hypothetical protein
MLRGSIYEAPVPRNEALGCKQEILVRRNRELWSMPELEQL